MALTTHGAARRNFIVMSASAAGALAFSLKIPTAKASEKANGSQQSIEIDSWIVIHPDDRVTIRIPQSEIGQGATTACAQLIADELDLDWKLTDWEFYDPQTNRVRNNVYVHTTTIASFGAMLLFEPMRIAGAQIRQMLVTAAAESMNVPAKGLCLDGHKVVDPESAKSIAFGKLASLAAKVAVPAASTVTPKPADKWRYIGKPVGRSDAYAKSTGQAKFGIDVSLPGMLYAAVRQSPVFGGRLVSFDDKDVLKMPGVRAVVKINAGPSGYTVPPILWDLIDWQMDDAVAVVAESWWMAQKALERLPVVWDNGVNEKVSSESIDSALLLSLAKPGKVVRDDGNADGVVAKAKEDSIIKSTYDYPFLEHAPIEPMNCTAVVNDWSVEAWGPTQFGDEALRITAYAAGIAIKDAKFHLTFVGGSFGRRLHSDYVSQAVQVAKALKGTPIKLIWSREECIRRSYYPPVSKAKFTGVINDKDVVAWKCHVTQGTSVFQPYGMTRVVYPIPNFHVQTTTIDTPPPFAWMRGVGHTQNFWMTHGFMCELAEAAGMGSYEYQMKLLDESRVSKDRADYEDAVERIRRFRKVLEFVVEKAGGNATVEKGHGRGVSIYDMSYAPDLPDSVCAALIDVTLDGKGGLKIDRVVTAIECGQVINPDIVKAQLQGGITFGLSNALYGKITLKDGRVQQSNFHDYPVLRIAQAPSVEVHIIPSDAKPTGIGEQSVPVAIGALVEAIYNAGGPRVRSLPVADNKLTFREA